MYYHHASDQIYEKIKQFLCSFISIISFFNKCWTFCLKTHIVQYHEIWLLHLRSLVNMEKYEKASFTNVGDTEVTNQ